MNILYAPGTNCQRETLEAFRRAGGEARLVYLSEALRGEKQLSDADVVCLPGGFSFGDHVGAGNIAAQFLVTRLRAQLDACRSKPMICVCNGFQMAARAGLFGDVTLSENSSGTFRDEPRQRHVVSAGNDSLWLRGLAGQTLTFPCAHGEGRFRAANQHGWKAALTYPAHENPDGSTDDIAGVTTPDGMVLGLMDHPERSLDNPGVLDIFRNGVRAAAG